MKAIYIVKIVKKNIINKMETLGRIELINYMGNDITIVNAARVSFKKEIDKIEINDIKLLNYLAKNNHFTPFTHGQIQLRIKMPIFVARQWFKSNIGISRNEISRRYISEEPSFYIPEYFRNKPDKSIKQGSVDIKNGLSSHFSKRYFSVISNSKQIYDDMIRAGIAPEMARMILPQSMHTEFIETGSLFAYFRIWNLRQDKHAQLEIQWFANEIDKIISEIFPNSWKALKNNKK